MTYVPLTPIDLLLAASLLGLNGGLSLAFELGLERTLAVAAARMVAQLLLAGLILKIVFEQTSPFWTALLALLMIGAAGWEALSRQERKIVGWRSLGLSTLTLFLVGTLSVLFAVGAVIRPTPWYTAQYVLPLLGMVLGNAMTGIALTLDAVTSNAHRERAAIEARLALGATRFEAMDGVLRRALRTGLMPILNAMAATGVVSLPGMMTGQILGGVPPIEAAKYQILIMFLLAGATALGVVMAGVGSVLLITDERQRLRLDRLARPAPDDRRTAKIHRKAI